jgi:hypothetical protein
VNLQEFLEKVESHQLDLLPWGLAWLFVARKDRDDLLEALKESKLTQDETIDLEYALFELGFKKIPFAPGYDVSRATEDAYGLPPQIDIGRLMKVHQL